MWSLGITAYEMATGKPPLANLPGVSALVHIPTSPPPRLGDGQAGAELARLVEECLELEPRARPSASTLRDAVGARPAAIYQLAKRGEAKGDLMREEGVGDEQGGGEGGGGESGRDEGAAMSGDDSGDGDDGDGGDGDDSDGGDGGGGVPVPMPKTDAALSAIARAGSPQPLLLPPPPPLP